MLQFPFIFSYNFTETCSSQRKIRFLSFRSMEKGGNTLPPCILTFLSYFCVVIAGNADLEGHILVDESLYQLRIIDGRNAMSDSLCSEG